MKFPNPEERAAILDQARELKMAQSAHAFVRGNTIKFYKWLAASKSAASVPDGPSIWICGDCHLGNLGPLADGDGHVEIQIRDLDQCVIGNPAHDLIRLGLSLATAARGSDLPGVTTARMVEQMVEGYADALAAPEADSGPEPDVVRIVRRKALGRRWRDLARERIEDVEPTIPLGKKFWPLDAQERIDLEALFDDEDFTAHILSLDPGEQSVRMVDAAFWMKGCSSLGLLRYAVVIALRDRNGREKLALIDIKEAPVPAAPTAKRAKMPKDQAKRVVAGACALSPNLGARMIAARLRDRSVFVRELMPQDLKLEVDQFSERQAVKAARYLAHVVGKAHGRQLDDDAKAAWRKTMLGKRHGTIDAPSWLWNSIVDLSGSHESGYLEYCRRYALAHAS